jgi:hypothetical protein
MVLAEELGLPFLPASLQLANSSDVSRGVNFAVGGATAIEVGFFERTNLAPFKLINNSQLEWFEELKPSICNATQGRFLFSLLCALAVPRAKLNCSKRTAVFFLLVFVNLRCRL